MVSGNTDAVEPRHMFTGKFKNICHNLHGRSWWIDIGVPHHKFLQNIVLDGSRKLFHRNTLLQTSNNIKGHNWDYSPVHGHGNGHFVQRNVVEQDFHVLDGIYGNTSLAHIADYTVVVRVIATVGGKVKSNGKPFLTCL